MQVHNSSPLSVKDIDASLKYGKIYASKLWSAFFIGLWAFPGMLVVVGALGIILDSDFNTWLLSLLVGVGMGALVCWIFLMMNLGKWQVKKWLLDAVVLKAITKKVGEIHMHRQGMCAAIQVRFSYMGKRLVKSSLEERKEEAAFSGAFNKYVYKKILIAYSPRYDQVMLIRPESERRIWAEHYESERTKSTP